LAQRSWFQISLVVIRYAENIGPAVAGLPGLFRRPCTIIHEFITSNSHYNVQIINCNTVDTVLTCLRYTCFLPLKMASLVTHLSLLGCDVNCIRSIRASYHDDAQSKSRRNTMLFSVRLKNQLNDFSRNGLRTQLLQ